MKEVYERYKDKGFEIITLSMDGNQETYENFIAESPMPWKQAFLVDGFNNPLNGPKYVFFEADDNILWVDARIIEELRTINFNKRR